MCYRYYLRLEPLGAGRFSPENLERMREYLLRFPVLPNPKLPDFYIVESFEIRDAILLAGEWMRGDGPALPYSGVSLHEDEVEIGVSMGGVEVLGEFVRWCRSLWPCRLFDDRGNEYSSDQFVAAHSPVPPVQPKRRKRK